MPLSNPRSAHWRPSSGREAATSAAFGLRLIHGIVGTPEKRVPGIACLCQCDANAGSDLHHRPGNGDRSFEILQDATHHSFEINSGRPRHENDEFISTESTDAVSGAQCGLQAHACLDQYDISSTVAELVVDPLEMIEVDEQVGDRGAVSPSIGKSLVDQLLEQP